jgi:predicted ATPase
MARYLSFELSPDDARKSDFPAYTLGTSSLLPHYFGDVAPVNIFLGENNSGKSRFMRSIMRCNPTRIFDFDRSADTLLLLVSSVHGAIQLAPDSRIYEIDATVQPAAKDNLELVKLFSKNSGGSSRHNRILLNPWDDINGLIRLLEEIMDPVSKPQLLLELVTTGQAEQTIVMFNDYLSNIAQVASLYELLGSTKLREWHLKLNSISNGYAVFASSHASIGFKAGNQATHFNTPNFKEQLSQEVSPMLRCVVEVCQPVLDTLISLNEQKAKTPTRIYLPTLRTARTLIDDKQVRLSSSNDVMMHTTIRDYGLSDHKLAVNTGFDLYNAVDKKYKATREERKELAQFATFLSDAFFSGEPVEIVPRRVDDARGGNILVTVGTTEHDLHDLGDGIQAIILLLYPLFIAGKGDWFFIEEPEIHLHPGFQRLFIETVTTHKIIKDKDLTIFLTTHSNHILDFALDEAKRINLFTFRKTIEKFGSPTYQIQLTQPQDLTSLNVLGVQNTSVFLSNCTIWVEGITDRLYLTAYLKVYLEYRKSQGERAVSLLEGMHFSFLEYAGSNVTHYEFNTRPGGNAASSGAITLQTLQQIKALSISNRILLIADRDAGAKKEERQAGLAAQQHDGFEFVVLDVREIENLLMPTIITKALQTLYPKKKFDANLLVLDDYKSDYLARYLEEHLANLPKSFVGPSGTVHSSKKRLFAEAASEAITSWDMLSDDAKKLTEQVFKFIMGHNLRLGSN